MNLAIAFFLGMFFTVLIWFISEISEIEISEIEITEVDQGDSEEK